MDLLCKKEVFTLNEFLDYLRSKGTRELERKARILNRNKKYKTIAIFTIAILINYSVSASANPFDVVGSKFWFYVKSFAKWACLICAGIDIIKSLNGGDSKNIGKVMFKYLIAYAAFSVLPWFFKEIDVAFSSMK